MVNLLFISNNSKIDIIKSALQPLLKVKIDIVGDFDYGLKDVFGKRPAVVFIQDQIAGVTGDSVGHHIQMLLGSGAPSFIYMHDGNPKAKPNKGLYDHLIDLSQDDAKVVADIQSTLELLLGQKWQQIYVSPRVNRSAVMATLAGPVEHRILVDQPVDDFGTDRGDDSHVPTTAVHQLTDFATPDASSEELFITASSPHEQLAEIISEYEREKQGTEAATAAAHDDKTENLFSPSGSTAPSVQNVPPAMLPESSKPDLRKAAIVSESPSFVPAHHSTPTVQEHSAPINPGVSERSKSPPISPADFIIERKRIAEKAAMEESFRAFEANYLSKTAARKWYQAVALVSVLCLLGGGW